MKHYTYAKMIRKNASIASNKWIAPTVLGGLGTGISYVALGQIPAFKRNRVLRILASLGIGGATAGGTYAAIKLKDRYDTKKTEAWKAYLKEGFGIDTNDSILNIEPDTVLDLKHDSVLDLEPDTVLDLKPDSNWL